MCPFVFLLWEQGTEPGGVMAMPIGEDEVLHPEPTEGEWCSPLLLGAM